MWKLIFTQRKTARATFVGNLDPEFGIIIVLGFPGSGIVVVISHRPSALEGLTHVLVMQEGRVAALGPRDEILARLQSAPVAAAARGQEQVLQKRAGEAQGRLARVGGANPRELPDPAVDSASGAPGGKEPVE